MPCALFRVVLKHLLNWALEVEVIIIIVNVVIVEIVLLLAHFTSNVHGWDWLMGDARMGMGGNVDVSVVVVLDHRLLVLRVVQQRLAMNDNVMLQRSMQRINDLL